MATSASCKLCNKEFFDGSRTRSHQHAVSMTIIVERTEENPSGREHLGGLICCSCVTIASNSQISVTREEYERTTMSAPAPFVPAGEDHVIAMRKRWAEQYAKKLEQARKINAELAAKGIAKENARKIAQVRGEAW